MKKKPTKPKPETMWMWHEDKAGWIPSMWGCTASECQLRAELKSWTTGNPHRVHRVTISLAKPKPAKKAKKARRA